MKKWNYNIMLTLNISMALLFLFAAAVQYNDPDWFRWMLIYGTAVLCCILWIMNRYYRIIPMMILLITLGWVAFLLPEVVGQETLTARMFDSFEMKGEGIEVAREVAGLLIITVWMGILILIPPDKLNSNSLVTRHNIE